MAAKDKQQKPHQTDEATNGLAQVGQLIRDARESHGMSAEALASSLHMGVEQLRALESARLDQLPEPVFVRAMVRRLASHLRLDADAMVEQLGTTQQRPAAPTTLATALPKTTVRGQRATGNRASSQRWILPGLILSGGAGLLIWQIHAGQLRRPAQEPGSTTGAVTSSAVTSAEVKSEAVDPGPTAAATAAAAAPSEVVQLPPEPLSVQISSVEPSWIALRREGKIEFQGTLDDPKTIPEAASVEIFAGRPDLVMVNVSDGQPRSVGEIHEVGWRQLIPEQPR